MKKAIIKVEIRERILESIISKINPEDLDEIIEDSLIDYFNLSIMEIGNPENVEVMKFKNESIEIIHPYYVYAILDPSYPEENEIMGIKFDFLPFYIGKGVDDRIMGMKNEKVQERIEQIRENGNNPIFIKVAENLRNYDAHKFEASLIYHSRLKGMEILNIAAGINFDRDYIILDHIKNRKITSCRLDDFKLKNCLISLNQEKTQERAAKKLGISTRTLQRIIKRYNIKKDSDLYYI